MACGELPEKYVLRTHLTDITDAVELNLQVIGTCLVEQGFITDRQLRNIVQVVGPTDESKAINLMGTVLAKINISVKREEWFEKFVLILSEKTTAHELVEKLTNALGMLNHMYATD